LVDERTSKVIDPPYVLSPGEHHLVARLKPHPTATQSVQK
jgi:hypothetical protein